MKTKKIFIALFTVAYLSSCSSSSEDKMAKLTELKTQMSELKTEIAKLESEVDKESNNEEGAINVATATIKPETYKHYIEVVGKVHADENTTISPESAGKITRILVEEGDRVKKGQVLAYLNNDALLSQIEQVKVDLDLAQTTYNRQEKLWNQNIGSEMEYLQAKSKLASTQQNLSALQAQLDMMSVKSQIDGVVDEVFQKKGEIAGPSIAFARVVNIDKIYIKSEVGEKFLGTIHKGDDTQVTFPAINKTVEAKIYRSSTVINDISRTFSVRININNTDNSIRPNLLSKVKLCVFSSDSLIVIPSLLVKKDFHGEFVFITNKEDGKTVAKKQYVKSVFNSDNKTIISEGLTPGNEIITTGYDQVVNGTAVNVKNS